MSQAESSTENKEGKKIPPCVDESITDVSKWLEARRRCFRIYTKCQKIDIDVNLSKRKASNLDLTEKAIRNTVESRLRSARLYGAGGQPYIGVYVTAVRNAFSASLEFSKYLNDGSSKISWWAVTWEQAYTGTHSNDSGYILSSISEMMESFLVEYLRVNEKACEWRSRQK